LLICFARCYTLNSNQPIYKIPQSEHPFENQEELLSRF
jgi:hypothetical protein